MTSPTERVDPVQVDPVQVAAAVLACPLVADLHGGPHATIATYLPAAGSPASGSRPPGSRSGWPPSSASLSVGS